MPLLVKAASQMYQGNAVLSCFRFPQGALDREAYAAAEEFRSVRSRNQRTGTYFHVLAGRHKYGDYLCIPNHDVGCELSDFSDIFWNEERLRGLMRTVDAVTVATGLVHLQVALCGQRDKSWKNNSTFVSTLIPRPTIVSSLYQ